MRVILNADDLGASPEVNDAIFDLMRRRLLTSATILANGPYVADAIRRIQEFPHCSFGVHLNGTEYQPLTAAPEFGPLLDDNGHMTRRIETASPSPALAQAVFREFCAQINRLLEAGVPLSHLDSHHHVHTLPFLFPAVKKLQARFGIRKARISQNLYPPGYRRTAAHRASKVAYNWSLRYIYRTHTTDAFTSVEIYHGLLRSGPAPVFDTLELMAHPGRPGYEAENALLESEWWAPLGERPEFFNFNVL